MPLAAGALRRRSDRRRDRCRVELRLRRTSFSSCTSGSCWRRSPASRSRLRSPGSISGRRGRLKRRAADILRLRLPPLASLERLTWRTVAVSLPAADARPRGGDRPPAPARRLGGRARGGHRRHLARLRRLPRPAADGPPRRVSRARRVRTRDRRAARARRESLRMTLTLVGLSHHVAPVELRERVTVDLAGAASLARSLGRRRLPVDLQSHRALCRRRSTRALSLATLEQLAGEPLGRRRLPPARGRRGAASLQGRRRPRLARAGGGRDSRPGPRGVRVGGGRAGARPRLPAGARGRQARAHGDRDRGEPRLGLVGGRRARRTGVRRPGRPPGAADRGRADRRARGVEPRVARRRDRLRREPDDRDGARARASLRRPRR